jgi:CRISPR-associated protein Cas1
MASIYILSDHGKLTKKDETFVFVQSDETKTILFPFKTKQLVIMGNVSLSGDALRLLAKYKISTTFLSSNGRFNGKLTFGDGKNVFLRQKQYKILDNPEESLKIAKSIVVGKIKNQISFMQRIKRKNDSSEQLVLDSINAIKNTLDNAQKADDIEKLRGYEGLAARQYFSVFGYNIQCEWAEFKTRSKNPPRSNVNSVLSFLYTLVMYRVESALEAQGLDVCCGNLHAINYGKQALVFDLMEEFRSAIADSVCCALFNLGTLNKDDFEVKMFSEDDIDYPLDEGQLGDEQEENSNMAIQAVLLTKPGIKKVIAAFETKMDTLILYQPTGQKLSYNKIIYEQAEHYKRVISGEETEYKAYYFK